MVTAVSSGKRKYPPSPSSAEQPYWLEVQLVDEMGDAVVNMPWKADSHHPDSGLIEQFTYSGQSDADGLIRIDMPHGLELYLVIETDPLLKEMETRTLRPGRNAEEDSTVRPVVEANGDIWHYAVVGDLCQTYPNIDLRTGETLPSFHFPVKSAFKGFQFRTNELEKRHVIEICPFRAWELVLHHQSEYSMANAINLGASASLAYADDKALDPVSITRFFINQCQDLSRLPQLHKSGQLYNTLVQDVPFSSRYYPPVFMDTSSDTSRPESTDEPGSGGNTLAITKNESDSPDGDTQLFYVYNTDKIIISWRGTAGLYDIGTDLAFSPVTTETCSVKKTQCTSIVPLGKVHDGFWSGYNRVERKFNNEIKKLRDLSETLDLFICGHSLGGALALIHSATLKSYAPMLYTYGMPRTFTRVAVEQLSSITHFRHVNDNDPVPSVPPEANLDNELYKLWGPLGKTLGMLWSVGELIAYQVKSWGDCFWHHGNPVVFLTATQSREWKECKRDYPTPAGCITLKRIMPIKAKLYLVPALAEQDMQNAGNKQKEFKASLTPKDLKTYFPEGGNPSRGADLTFDDHFMTSYMPFMNNKLLELIDKQEIVKSRDFTEHSYSVDEFKEQMQEEKMDIPVTELERNEIFLNIEGLLSVSLTPTLSMKNGNDALERFALYGEEVLENV
ncbi:lipase family protein [Scandinavium sp. V105_16]|uniref:Lipase family protein n=1 Tax=Scandinavium lactucae TaxID=3095028 RepID=A0AAJ2S191_9ENTR|nr:MULTISPECIES: lipase family protein [unclassified Scandinavium]MDX6018879.1 lipase family protein [Scandinavium sp. V105_16]MDX6030159.1 lipase family protein [Scandinavium sp. V105_12]